MANKISVEVAYAAVHSYKVITVSVAETATVQEAIFASGILSEYPEIDLNKQKIGIFSKPCQLSDGLKANDRIEIYRPLTIDPKEARRAKAKKLRR